MQNKQNKQKESGIEHGGYESRGRENHGIVGGVDDCIFKGQEGIGAKTKSIFSKLVCFVLSSSLREGAVVKKDPLHKEGSTKIPYIKEQDLLSRRRMLQCLVLHDSCQE